MTNDQAYADGLLNRALDPATQPEAVRQFLREEIQKLHQLIPNGSRVIDFGCGTGRHLGLLGPKLKLGVGIDYQWAYISQAVKMRFSGPLHFIVGDGTQVPCRTQFDTAISMTNTWGTIPDKEGFLKEMRRLAPQSGHRILSVFSTRSVGPRLEWYSRLGHEVIAETPEYLETTGGFRSEHFSKARIRELVGKCQIEPLGPIGYLIIT